MTPAADGERTDWQRRALEAEAGLQEARAERARLWEQVTRLQRERQDVAYHESVVARMEGSASWKLTEPLRAAKTLAVKLRRRLDQHG